MANTTDTVLEAHQIRQLISNEVKELTAKHEMEQDELKSKIRRMKTDQLDHEKEERAALNHKQMLRWAEHSAQIQATKRVNADDMAHKVHYHNRQVSKMSTIAKIQQEFGYTEKEIPDMIRKIRDVLLEDMPTIHGIMEDEVFKPVHKEEMWLRKALVLLHDNDASCLADIPFVSVSRQIYQKIREEA